MKLYEVVSESSRTVIVVTASGNLKRYTTALSKMTSTVLLKRGNDGIAVYVSKYTILKEMATKIEEVKPAFLF
jgi:hypothetical protein